MISNVSDSDRFELHLKIQRLQGARRSWLGRSSMTPEGAGTASPAVAQWIFLGSQKILSGSQNVFGNNRRFSARALDRTYFTGSANFTNKSHRNRERVFRMTGEVVGEISEDLCEERRLGVLWDGQ